MPGSSINIESESSQSTSKVTLLDVCMHKCKLWLKQLHKNKLQLHVTLGLICQLR